MHSRLQPYASQAATLCIPGELDDSRLVEAAAGERFVFKRRGTETEAPRGEQESYLVISPLGGGMAGGAGEAIVSSGGGLTDLVLTYSVPTMC